jgi:hypothetical protein
MRQAVVKVNARARLVMERASFSLGRHCLIQYVLCLVFSLRILHPSHNPPQSFLPARSP